MQLLSVACLSLAAKMEEPLVPSLLELQVLVKLSCLDDLSVPNPSLALIIFLDETIGALHVIIYSLACFVDPRGNNPLL